MKTYVITFPVRIREQGSAGLASVGDERLVTITLEAVSPQNAMDRFGERVTALFTTPEVVSPAASVPAEPVSEPTPMVAAPTPTNRR